MMVVTDSLTRTIEFGYEDFFKSVRIRDATRAPYHIPDSIELPRSHMVPYFLEGNDIRFLLQGINPNRIPEERFNLSLKGQLFYRKDSEETITITVGFREEGIDRNEIRKVEDAARPSECGTYLIKLVRLLSQKF